MSTRPLPATARPEPPHVLPESPDVYKTLLESTRAIPWKIDWASMRFAYIGPQIETLLGWEQDSWQTVDDWVARMHPDDRATVVDFCVSQSRAGVDHEADYRALTRDGGYVWIRDVVHVVRDAAGEVDSLVGFMFDISQRKHDEEELLRLHRDLEQLSLTDSLTGISNRRSFDQCLEIEWNAARRSAQPLSLVVLDLDHFKQFNDAHGHLAGDECLQKIAGALRAIARRPRDIVARFGGEEFILLLPETGAAAAALLAQECVARIAALRIAHGGQGAGAFVTASLGLGTVAHVDAGATARDFLEAVDGCLYAAKRAGRNRIETLQGTATDRPQA
ncbi:sensor domain-containing diguanylate cyclase [Pseudoxanthomonas daejeonensis]|uniref:GGDEF domain-containing protein n=1 Tax=Pseudoxanthomonas daejeonensis TaxID=266062 RepID=UPI001F544583|nr:sensor domain-containing diguanylate cyclase [Pseudoxanthomonas daejeonensis]UNK57227.1 sensor domain-containing diguanylate cyclase [Pseudoxanthomonas daejeonensis]